jgi:MYXO-CTERM domain-containing protein
MAATLVCASQVCDTKDNECGYANGDGPCSPGDGGDGGASVCRSGFCATNNLCEGPGSCSSNQDCTDPTAPICDPVLHTCEPADGGGGSIADASEDGSGIELDGAAPDAEAGSTTNVGADSGLDGGYVEGGGCSVASAPSGSGPSSMAGLLVGAALAVGARRRRSR